MAQVAAVAIPALIGAYSARQQARAASQPVTTSQNGTTTQRPLPIVEPLLNVAALDSIRNYQNPARIPTYQGVDPSSLQSQGVLDQLLGLQYPDRPLDATNQSQVDFINSMLAPARSTPRGGSQFNNEIMSDIFNTLRGSSYDQPRDMILDFLNRDQAQQPEAEDGPLRPGGSGTGVGAFNVSGGIAPGGIPDMFGRFNRESEFFFDDARLDPANDPTLSPVLDLLQSEGEEDFGRVFAGLEARQESRGRLGSGETAGLLGAVTDEHAEALAQARAALLAGQRDEALNRRLQALGLVENVGEAELAAYTSRANANTAAGASLTGSRLAADLERERLALDRELGLRGQDLSALGLLTGISDSELGILSGLSGQLSQDRLAAAGLGAQRQSFLDALLGQRAEFDLNRLLGAGDIAGGIDQRLAADAQARYGSQRERANAQEDNLDRLIARLLGLSSIGGVTTTQGTGFSQGPRYDATAAAFQGALGGGLSGYAAYDQANRSRVSDGDIWASGSGGTINLT